MNDQIFIFVLLLVGIGTMGRLAQTWIRARHGLPIESGSDRLSRRMERYRSRRYRHPLSMFNWGWGDQADADDESPSATRKIELLSSENERLTGQIGRLEERLRVLERIATDPAERTAREIDALRNSVD